MRKVKIAQRGSALIVLIVTMLIMGTLGTSMYLLTTTGTFGSIFANKANRALLLAESGIRYAQKTGFVGSATTYTMNGGVDSFTISYNAGTRVITSTGIADANSLWKVQRKMTYALGSLGGTGTTTGDPATVPGGTVGGGTGSSTGDFVVAEHKGNAGAINVDKVKGNVDNPSSYPEAYGTPDWGSSNPFCQPWKSTGYYLSYDFQLKLAEEHSYPDAWVSTKTYNYDDVVRYGGDTNYWICQTKGGCKSHPDNGWSHVVFVYNLGALFRVSELDPQTNAYGLTYFRSTRYDDNGDPIDGVDETMFPDNLVDNAPAIVLFSRDGGANTGLQNSWLAYKKLSGTDYVVDQYGFLKDWDSLVVRVIEAASIKSSSFTYASQSTVQEGDTVTSASGGTAKVIKKIHDSDGKEVLLLNNVVGAFNTGTGVTVGGTSYAAVTGWGDPVPGTAAAWVSGTNYARNVWVTGTNGLYYYCTTKHTASSTNRPITGSKWSRYWHVGTPPTVAGYFRLRDNYIWAFFADTTAHPTYNNVATDNTRIAKPLFTDPLPSGYSPTFPITAIKDWAAATDDFTLVQWEHGYTSDLNTAADSSLKLMGKGKEEFAIIRTNEWTSESYPTDCTGFPAEIGIVAKGTVSMQFAYDDLAYRILHGAGSGGGGGSAGYYSY